MDSFTNSRMTRGRRSSNHRCTSICSDHEVPENEPLLRPARSERSGYGGVNEGGDLTGGSLSESGRHCHASSTPEDTLDKTARKKLLLASGFCLTFMIAEIVGGVLANSLAVATDAAHLLTDFASFMISLVSLYLASRPATKKMSFGWYRAEVMGALISVLLIWVVTGVLFYMAVQRVITEDYEIDAKIMLITAACGVAFNIVMGATLHGHGHSHGGHGHSHGGDSHTVQQPRTVQPSPDIVSGTESNTAIVEIEEDYEQVQKEKENINVRAAFIHVLGDLVQSIGVLIAAFIIYYKPNWKIADPICTFLFSILVLFTTITILKDILNVLMEGTPRGIQFNDVKECLCEVKGVREIHNLRIWSLTMSKTAVSVHLALDKRVNHQEVLNVSAKLMTSRFGISECTIQIEDYVDEMEDCEQCRGPED